MKLKFRNQFAVAAVGALACSLAFQPIASADQSGLTEDERGLQISEGTFSGRISGADRFGTAVAASKALGTSVGNTVILANWQSWSDVLASTPLADIYDAPVLYTLSGELGATTKEELIRLWNLNDQDLNVIIVGGESVVGQAVVDELEGLDSDNPVNVDRISGTDRYETALMLALEAVDNYSDSDGDLAEDRETIRDIIQAEADFQAALAAWDASRADTEAAFNDLQAAQSAVDAANDALQALIDQLVSVPTAEADDLNDLNNDLVQARDDLADLGTLESFINDRLSTYVADGNSDGFQDDIWNTDVVPFFGATEFTIVLNEDTYTGTLTELAAEIAAFGEAVTEGGTDNTVKQVEVELDDAMEAAQAEVEAAQAAYALLVAALVAQAEAEENNAALMGQIADAQEAIVAAEAVRDDRQDDLDEARADEAERKDDFVDATADRPDGDDLAAAQLAYEDEIETQLGLAKAYPAFVSTGRVFADALASGPAAAGEAGVVLLTQGTTMAPATQRYLDEGPSIIGVGGPAVTALAGEADFEYNGATRYETATLLAAAYYDDPEYVGLASGRVAADAVVGGALMANVDAGIVLTAPDQLSAATSTFLSYEVDNPYLVIFGGPSAISNGVRDQAVEALTN